jgi:DNA-binding winged helix-turn-helix (wHTH) protein
MDDVASFGPFRLFSAARALEKNGVPVALGDRALDILIVLIDSAGLRKALGESERYIANVPGQGYCFVAQITRGTAASPARSPEFPDAARKRLALPPKLDRMVGREEIVRSIGANLIAERFLTIIGPGGMGKTTVAVAVAHAMLDEFDNAVCFVDIGAVTDPNLVAATIASSLGLAAQTTDVLPTLLEYLRTLRILLVLDNCEHVVDTMATIAETIFRDTSGVHILATSRRAIARAVAHPGRCAPVDIAGPCIARRTSSRAIPPDCATPVCCVVGTANGLTLAEASRSPADQGFSSS